MGNHPFHRMIKEQKDRLWRDVKAEYAMARIIAIISSIYWCLIKGLGLVIMFETAALIMKELI